jgi:hypothetical protein
MVKFSGSAASVQVKPVVQESSWPSTRIDSIVGSVTLLVGSLGRDYLLSDKLEKDEEDDDE